MADEIYCMYESKSFPAGEFEPGAGHWSDDMIHRDSLPRHTATGFVIGADGPDPSFPTAEPELDEP